jgi:cytochrome c
MTTRRLGVWIAAGLAALVSSAALAEGDPEQGAKVFNKCKACHVADEEKNRVGPHLVHIVGRPAASVEGYNYSTALEESGIVWDEEILDQYLASPKEVVPGGKMQFIGLRAEEERADVIAYLKSLAH